MAARRPAQIAIKSSSKEAWIEAWRPGSNLAEKGTRRLPPQRTGSPRGAKVDANEDDDLTEAYPPSSSSSTACTRSTPASGPYLVSKMHARSQKNLSAAKAVLGH